MKHYTSPRIQRAQLFLMKVSSYLEIVCALILIVAILIAFVPVPHNLYSLYLDNGFDLSDFMKKSYDLVIGVELLKMFCRHDLDSVVEVLLFAVARQVIIEHTSMVDNLLCMLSVAILFCIRKFLFVSALDKKEPALKAINPVFKGAVSQQTPSQKQNEKKETEAEEESRERILKAYSRNSLFE